MPCSGRRARGRASYCGPPTAPRSTASAVLARSSVESGSGLPAVSTPAPPIGAVSVSIETPSRRSRSSTFAASATISVPMPSPGSNAIFTPGPRRRPCAQRTLVAILTPRRADAPSGEPRLFGETLGLERADLVGVPQRQADLVQPVEQAMLAEWLDIEGERMRAVGGCDRLPLEIDGQRKAGRGEAGMEQAVHVALGEHDRQQAVLEAIVEEDVGERRRDERAKAIVGERPRRVLARAAAAEVAAGEQYLRAAVARLVQHEIRVLGAGRRIGARLAPIEIAPGVEQVRSEARPIDRL